MDDFIFKVPKWQGELAFSEEMVMFLLTILLVIVGVLFCIWGYKYFQTICFMGISGVLCYIAYTMVEQMTSNRVIQLALSVALTFWGLCVVYFISIILGYMLDKVHLKKGLVKKSFLFTSVSGGAVLGLTTYYGIYHNVEVAVSIGVVSGVLGMLIQYKNRKKQIQFKTYHDVLKMELPEEYANDLEYIDLDKEDAHSAREADAAQDITEIKPVETLGVVTAATVESEPSSEPESMAATVESEPSSEPEAAAATVESEPSSEPESMAATVESEPSSEPEAAAATVESEPSAELEVMATTVPRLSAKAGDTAERSGSRHTARLEVLETIAELDEKSIIRVAIAAAGTVAVGAVVMLMSWKKRKRKRKKEKTSRFYEEGQV